MYKYNQRNLINKPEFYMYSTYEGPKFIKEYFKDRERFLKNKKNILSKKNYQNEIKQLLTNFNSFRSVKNRISNYKFKNRIYLDSFLIKVINNIRKNKNVFKEINFLIRKFEVKKKLFLIYDGRFKKGISNNKFIDIYVLFSFALCFYYIKNRNIKVLNTIIKVNDVLSSVTIKKRLHWIPYRFIEVLFLFETLFVKKLKFC